MTAKAQFCLCGGRQPTLTRIRTVSFPGRSLYSCLLCGTAQLFPYPVLSNEARDLYQDGDYLKKIDEREYYGYFHVLLDYIRSTLRCSKETSILDFGSGYSYYHKFFLQEGFRTVHSLEVNEHLVRFAREQLGLPNIYADARELREHKYDLILANQVLEHLYNPIDLINNTLHDMLRDRGTVCFTVPNLDSYNRLLLRNLWVGYSPDEHIWFFNKRSISRIFAGSTKFSILDMSVKSAVNTPHDGFRPGSLVKRVYYRTAMRAFEYIGKGDQLIVALEKR